MSGALDELLQDYHDSEDLHPAVVLQADTKQIRAYRRGGEVVTITGDGLKFAARMIDEKAPPNKRLRRGAIIRVQKDEKDNWRIMQMPEVESAFLSVDPQNGAIRSLVGGFGSAATSSTTRPSPAAAGIELQAIHLLRRT